MSFVRNARQLLFARPSMKEQPSMVIYDNVSIPVVELPKMGRLICRKVCQRIEDHLIVSHFE